MNPLQSNPARMTCSCVCVVRNKFVWQVVVSTATFLTNFSNDDHSTLWTNQYFCVNQVQRHLENCAEKSKQHRGGGTNLGCPFCTFVFHKKNIRNLHLLSHIDTGLSCALCDDGVVWSDWKSLRKHYQQKHSKVMNDKISPFIHDLPNRQPPLRYVYILHFFTIVKFN